MTQCEALTKTSGWQGNQINGLAQDCSNSSANALKLSQSLKSTYGHDIHISNIWRLKSSANQLFFSSKRCEGNTQVTGGFTSLRASNRVRSWNNGIHCICLSIFLWKAFLCHIVIIMWANIHLPHSCLFCLVDIREDVSNLQVQFPLQQSLVRDLYPRQLVIQAHVRSWREDRQEKTGICHCISGKLWYLQHHCVGDTIVYH